MTFWVTTTANTIVCVTTSAYFRFYLTEPFHTRAADFSMLLPLYDINNQQNLIEKYSAGKVSRILQISETSGNSQVQQFPMAI